MLFLEFLQNVCNLWNCPRSPLFKVREYIVLYKMIISDDLWNVKIAANIRNALFTD